MFDGEAEGEDRGEPWAKLVLERLDEAENASADRGSSAELESVGERS